MKWPRLRRQLVFNQRVIPAETQSSSSLPRKRSDTRVSMPSRQAPRLSVLQQISRSARASVELDSVLSVSGIPPHFVNVGPGMKIIRFKKSPAKPFGEQFAIMVFTNRRHKDNQSRCISLPPTSDFLYRKRQSQAWRISAITVS
jgi:hypothetical protein